MREPEAEAKDERPPIDLSRASVRVVVTETRTGKVKLETRIPSRFLDPLSMVVPQLVRRRPPARSDALSLHVFFPSFFLFWMTW